MKWFALLVVAVLLAACGGAEPTPVPTATPEPPVEAAPVDPAAATVGDWVSGADRAAVAEHWATYWAENGGQELTAVEMEACISDKALNGCCGYSGQVPLTLMIMSVAGECAEGGE